MQRSWVDVACQAYGVGCWKEQGYCEEVAKGNTRSSWKQWYLLAAWWHMLGVPKGGCWCWRGPGTGDSQPGMVPGSRMRSQQKPRQCPAMSAPYPFPLLEELLSRRCWFLTSLLHIGTSCTLSSAGSLGLLNLLETMSRALAPSAMLPAP